MGTTTYRRAAGLGLLAVGSLLLAECGTSTDPSTRGGPATGVVIGRVTAGPTCPVERVGHACPPRPVVAEVQASAAGRIVASTHSGADGSYRLELPGGTYTVVAVTLWVPKTSPGPLTCGFATSHVHGGGYLGNCAIRPKGSSAQALAPSLVRADGQKSDSIILPVQSRCRLDRALTAFRREPRPKLVCHSRARARTGPARSLVEGSRSTDPGRRALRYGWRDPGCP